MRALSVRRAPVQAPSGQGAPFLWGADRRLRGQLLAALGAAVCQHLAAADSRHARAESVPMLADELGRLIGALHEGKTPTADAGQTMPRA